MSLPPAQAPRRATGCGSARTSRRTSAALSCQSRARRTNWKRMLRPSFGPRPRAPHPGPRPRPAPGHSRPRGQAKTKPTPWPPGRRGPPRDSGVLASGVLAYGTRACWSGGAGCTVGPGEPGSASGAVPGPGCSPHTTVTAAPGSAYRLSMSVSERTVPAGSMSCRHVSIMGHIDHGPRAQPAALAAEVLDPPTSRTRPGTSSSATQPDRHAEKRISACLPGHRVNLWKASGLPATFDISRPRETREIIGAALFSELRHQQECPAELLPAGYPRLISSMRLRGLSSAGQKGPDR